MSELKPCPFCGGEYTQVRYIGGEWQEPSAFESGYRGECCSCHAITAAYNTEAEAAEAWNTRHVETCRNVSDPPEGFLCSECGWGDFAEPSHLLTGSCYAGLAKGPRYCPNCGKRVIE